MTELYSIGLDDRDRLNHSLGGGFPKGAIVLIEGSYGDGKSVMCQRFIRGMCGEGTYVSLVSTELDAMGFVAQMDSLNYDVVNYLLQEQLLFLAADVDVQNRLSGQAPRRELLSRLMEPSPMWNADVVIIDTLDAILNNDARFSRIAAAGEGARAIQNLVSYLREMTAGERTVIITVDPTSLEERYLRPLREVADVYLVFAIQTVGQERRRSLSVRRYLGMSGRVTENIGFMVQPNRGIIIESRVVA